MNRSSGDQVIVRVENRCAISPRHVSRTVTDSPQFNIMSSQQSRVCEERNDALWDEQANLRNDSSSQECITTSSAQSGPPFPSEGLTREADASAGRDASPRRPPLDLDIHLNEPNLVLLQDNLLPCSKPLCDHLGERHFSLRPSSQRVVRIVSSSSTVPPAGPKLEEEKEQGNAAPGQRRVSKAANLNVETGRKGKEESGSAETSAAMGSSGAVERKSTRTVMLSKELVKTRTKSRLVEASLPSAPASAAAAASSGRFSEAERKCSPKSSARHSSHRTSHRMEAEGEEEDPFKDIDAGDKFIQGKLTPITVAQWVAFFVVMGSLICSVVVRELKVLQLWGLELWKWFLLVLVVLCGRLVSGWLIRILVIVFEKNFLLRKKVMYFVYGLHKGVQNCVWLGLVLLAWKLMFDPRVKRTTSNYKALLLVTRLLQCFLLAAFIWLLKILLIKSLASSFHVTTFFNRIQESLFNQHVLEALSGAPRLDLAFDSLSFHGKAAKTATQKDQKTDTKISIEDLQKISTRNVSPGLMKRLMHLVRHPGLGTLVTTIDESVCVDQDSEDIEINSELEAKAAAKRIFRNVAQQDSKSIEIEDLLRFVTSDEVLNVLCLFEGAKETGKITKQALKNWVVRVYQERKALAHSLNDTKTAVKELHRMASVVVILIIIVVWLLILEIATTKVLLFVISQLLVAGFMFNNTVKQVFEAIIFLFVMHPFDVGDRCIIDGIQMVVEEMKILSTVFLKVDNEKVFYPNSVLSTKPISNLYRSPNMKDILNFSVHISTPAEKITALREKITVYVEGKSEQWHPKFSMVVTELEDLNRMRLSVSMQHTINFQNFAERLNRRSDLLLEFKRIFAELGIEYRLLTQSVYLTYPPPPPPVPSQLLPPAIYPTPVM